MASNEAASQRPKVTDRECLGRRGRWSSLPLLAGLLALPSSVGCFSHPESAVSSMRCQVDENCPVGYECTYRDVVGGCRKIGAADRDAGSNGDLSPEHPVTLTSADGGYAAVSADPPGMATDSAAQSPYPTDSDREAVDPDRDASRADHDATDSDRDAPVRQDAASSDRPLMLTDTDASETPGGGFDTADTGTSDAKTDDVMTVDLVAPADAAKDVPLSDTAGADTPDSAWARAESDDAVSALPDSAGSRADSGDVNPGSEVGHTPAWEPAQKHRKRPREPRRRGRHRHRSREGARVRRVE
jgi:hypothetical protein